MYDKTVTLFNYYEESKTWFPSVISGVQIQTVNANTFTSMGINNADTMEFIIKCSPEQMVMTSEGAKQYIGPKEYARCTAPEEVLTFAPDTDFIFVGVWSDLSPVKEDEDSEGLYQEMNEEHDGVYMVNSVASYGLLPHFEIGGR